MDAVVKVFWFYFIALIPGAVLCLSFKSIGTTYGENVFQCNMDYQLVCQTESRPVSIVIRINGTQAAYCLNANCIENRDILGDYTVSNDTSVGILRLHIHNVSDTDASNIFTCEGDSTSKSIQPVIKVVPEKSSTQLIINESNSTDVTDIQALTGCVLLRSNLTFVWNKTRYSNGTFLEPLSDKDFISISPVSEEFDNCIASDYCGGTARSNTLIFREETIGGTYYFITCTIVIDKNDTGSFTQTYTVISERSFAFKGYPADPGEKKKLQMGLGLGLGVGLPAIAATCIIVFLIKDPVFDVNVLSKKIVGSTMTITLQWKCRLYKMKTFHVKLKNGTHSVLNFTESECRVFKHELSNLKLNSNYSAYVYSTMCKFRSCRKNIEFRTNASDEPGTPEGFELVRDSVTEVSAAFRCIPKSYQPDRQKIVLFCQQANNGNHIAENAQIIDKAGAITLTINNLRHGSMYDCSVFARSTNMQSGHSEKIRIMTLGLPDAPTDFRVVRVENNCVRLSWIPGLYRMNHQWFFLELMNKMNGDITVEKITMSHVIPIMHTVTKLSAGTTFVITLLAENDVGRSESVGPIVVTTTTENPVPSSELRETAVTPSSITVCWKPGGCRRQAQSFAIEYGRAKKQFENIKWKHKTKNDDLQPLMTFNLDNLRPETKYAIAIFVENDIMSYRTEPIIVKTEALKPPKRFEFLSIEDDKITVSWEPAFSDTNQIFRLTFYNMVTKCANEKEKEQTEVFVKYQKPVMIKTVTGLQKNTMYQFEISAFMGTKKSISLIDFVQTTGTKDASETQRTGPKLNTTVHHFTR